MSPTGGILANTGATRASLIMGSTKTATVVTLDGYSGSGFHTSHGGLKAGGVGVRKDAPHRTPIHGGAKEHWCLLGLKRCRQQRQHGGGMLPPRLVSDRLAGTTTLRSNLPLTDREEHRPADRRQARGVVGGGVGGGAVSLGHGSACGGFGDHRYVSKHQGRCFPPGGCRDASRRPLCSG